MDSQRGELVFGLVGALGTDLDNVSTILCDILRSFQYEPVKITLSKLFEFVDLSSTEAPSDGNVYHSDEARRIVAGMDRGDLLRKTARENLKDAEYNNFEDWGDAAVALLSIRETRRRRAKSPTSPRPKAYILKSLKHPAEVDLLRKVYRDSFFCISIYSSEESRLEYLVKQKGVLQNEAADLTRRDESDETKKYGQKTSRTFELGDVFISHDCKKMKSDIERFIDLVFGSPSITPSLDEHAMYIAYSASLRSGDLSRQVGASIFSKENDLLSIGSNDVPRFGGGQYWPGEEDARDVVKSTMRTSKRRQKLPKVSTTKSRIL